MKSTINISHYYSYYYYTVHVFVQYGLLDSGSCCHDRFFFQEDLQDENMQEMDILDMNVLDETENDNGIPAEDYDDDENENFPEEDDAELNEDHDNRDFESEDEARHPEVR